MRKQLLYVVFAALVPLSVGSADGPLAEDDCRRSPFGTIIPGVPGPLPRPMLAQGRIIDARASELASAYQKVESALREADYEPNEFSDTSRSWTAIVRGDEVLVAVYDRDEEQILRKDAFGTEHHHILIPLVRDVEQALANTPEDCGTAFGVVDAGMVDENGDELIYSLRLGNGQEHVWGMHYRFHRRDGELAHVERLHVVCDVNPTVLTEASLEHVPERMREMMLQGRIPRHIKLSGGSTMPGHDMPTEAQLLQFHLVPEFYFDTAGFRVREGIVQVDPHTATVRNRFTRVPSSCDVVERTED